MTNLAEDLPLATAAVLTEASENRSGHLSFATKTLYGSGALVEVVINTVLTNFHLFYLTAVCGLSGALAGTSAFLALAVDAFVDPFVGSLSDNTRSRWGRRHPYMILSAVPIALSFGLLFSIPRGFSGSALFFYSTAMLLCMRFGLSAFVIPFMAMGSELSDDYHERSVVVAYRHAFGIVAAFLPVLIGLPLFLKGGNVMVRAAYVPYAWSCAAMVLVGALVCSFGSLGARDRLHAVGKSAPPRQFLKEVGEVFQNRSFRILFAALVIFFVAQGAAGVLALHALKFFWNLSSSVIAAVQIAVPLGSAVGIPFIWAAAKKLEKRTITLGGQLAFCILQGALPLLRIAGLLPPDGLVLNAIIIAYAFGLGVIVTALVIGFQSMMADAADEHDLLFGARREGIYFAGLSFSVKLTAAAGVLIAGFALDAIGFPTAIAAKMGQGLHIAADTVRNLGLIAGPGPAALTLFCIAVTWGYSIDRRKLGEIQAALAERNRARPPV
ncbi:MAG: MFS transporter [Alphaproteobacteria bacterium]|nr:MFS transporter [Alphaproteobacteria bacterium]